MSFSRPMYDRCQYIEYLTANLQCSDRMFDPKLQRAMPSSSTDVDVESQLMGLDQRLTKCPSVNCQMQAGETGDSR
jgi:hypothetical protein